HGSARDERTHWRIVHACGAERSTREGVGVSVADDRLVSAIAGRDEQRRLGETVDGKKRTPREADVAKARVKRLERVSANRLGAVVGDAPRPQIQLGTLRVRDLSYAEIVREVRTAARGGAVAMDGAQPANRSMEKRRGRHEVRRIRVVD